MSETLRQRLSGKGVLVADGATGTMLQAAGLTEGTAPESWNLTHPEKILDLHRAYLEAGSQIILTNSFGGIAFGWGRRDCRIKCTRRTALRPPWLKKRLASRLSWPGPWAPPVN